MGKKIKAIYDEVFENYGHIGLYRLVVRVKISPEMAETVDDDDETIATVIKAIEELGLVTNYGTHSKKRKNIIRRLFRW